MSKDGRYTGALDERLAALTIETAKQHLATAKLTHQKITEQISMRTTTIASIAGNIFAEMLTSSNRVLANFGDAKNVVQMATEIVEAAEAAASKSKELQDAKDSKN